MRKIQLKQEENKDGRTFKVLKIGGVILLLVVILEVWMVNRLSTYGGKLQELSVMKNELELENNVLKGQIAESSALSLIESKAKKLGFDSISKIEYIKQDSLASAQ